MILKTRNKHQIELVFKNIESRSIAKYSQQILPAYRHIPGMTPHPISDKNGHSYNKSRIEFVQISMDSWQRNEEYLYAIDLFNNAFYWEAHETLEEFWLKMDNAQYKLFLQGLIQVSAAYLKWVQGIAEGMNKLTSKGLKKISEVSQTFQYLFGINLNYFIEINNKFLSEKHISESLPPAIILQMD